MVIDEECRVVGARVEFCSVVMEYIIACMIDIQTKRSLIDHVRLCNSDGHLSTVCHVGRQA